MPALSGRWGGAKLRLWIRSRHAAAPSLIAAQLMRQLLAAPCRWDTSADIDTTFGPAKCGARWPCFRELGLGEQLFRSLTRLLAGNCSLRVFLRTIVFYPCWPANSVQTSAGKGVAFQPTKPPRWGSRAALSSLHEQARRGTSTTEFFIALPVRTQKKRKDFGTGKVCERK